MTAGVDAMTITLSPAMAEMARTLARNSKSRNVKDYIEELIFAQYQQSRR